MSSASLENKRIFTVVSKSTDVVQKSGSFIQSHIANATLFTAEDGIEALFKMDNVPPHVALIDVRVDKIPIFELITKILKSKRTKQTSIVLLSAIPDNEQFVDEVVQCRIQFLPDINDLEMFSRVLSRALNRIALQESSSSYKLKFLGTGETLFRQDDMAQSIYFVKRGVLRAFQQSAKGEKVLGDIKYGEFVGEMAHFNMLPRSATVTALADCELIEIPFDALEVVLFSKPSWSKALIYTLTQRLQSANQKPTEGL